MTFCLFVSLKSDILSILAHYPRVYRLHFVSKGRVSRAKCQTLLILYAFFLQVSWRSGDRGVEKGSVISPSVNLRQNANKGQNRVAEGTQVPDPFAPRDEVSELRSLFETT